MELNSEIAVVSIFGRGHWLASEIAKQGIPVSLIDISEQMGSWAPEDWEGPFGFFNSEKRRPLQIERMLEDDSLEATAQGWTFWLADGPLEMKGLNVKHRLNKLGIKDELQHLVSGEYIKSKIPHWPFAENWFAQLLSGFTANRFFSNTEALDYQRTLPAFNSFSFRQATRNGLRKNLQWCQSLGVQIPKQIQIVDLLFLDRKTLKGFEVKSDRPGLFTANRFIWCLTSEETGLLGSRVQAALFPKGGLEASWSWIRYRVKMSGGQVQQIPNHVVMVGDVHLPWTHENAMIMQRTSSSDRFDVWLRIPTVQRFNKQYLEEKAQLLILKLKERTRCFEAKIQDYPQEYEYTYNQLGPSRHPVYEKSSLKRFKPKSLANVSWDGPEYWDHLGWEGAFHFQNEILQDVSRWWIKKEELRKKKEAKLAKR